MEYLKYFVFVGLVLLILDQTALWFERKGWLFYRYKKPATAGGGNALHQMNSFIDHSTVVAQESLQQSESSGVQDDRLRADH